MKVSVAMASYNGEKYIADQIESICTQLTDDDELIISDDGSTDNTVRIVEEFAEKYPQIRLIQGPKEGIAANFSNAMMHCKGDIIFLSDQDDVWFDTKADRIKKLFSENKQISLILHNAYILNNKVTKQLLFNGYRKGVFCNIIKSSYWGCCMAFKREFISRYLPLDKNTTAHDQLIGLLSEREKGTLYTAEPLMAHRIHKTNKTKRLTLKDKISFRGLVIRDYRNAKRKNRTNLQ